MQNEHDLLFGKTICVVEENVAQSGRQQNVRRSDGALLPAVVVGFRTAKTGVRGMVIRCGLCQKPVPFRRRSINYLVTYNEIPQLLFK